MKPSSIADAMQDLYGTKEPVFLWGPPGVGKSQVARQAADRQGVQFLDVRLVYHDPSDLKFPLVKQEEEVLKWINSIFPKDPDWKGLVCLEELPQCPPLMQAAAMQLSLDRCVGDYRLPDGAWVVACGNRAEDRAAANRVITPLLNRFIHLDMEVSHSDWMAWAIDAGVGPEVRGFLNFKPALLHQFDPRGNDRAFPTPRSWEKVSRVLPKLRKELRHPVIAGTVGAGPAAEFVAFVDIYEQLPDPDQVLANPTGSHVPQEPSVLFAIVGAISERIKNGKRLSEYVKYVSRLPTEFSVLAMQEGCRAQRGLLMNPESAAWLRKNQAVMLAS